MAQNLIHAMNKIQRGAMNKIQLGTIRIHQKTREVDSLRLDAEGARLYVEALEDLAQEQAGQIDRLLKMLESLDTLRREAAEASANMETD